MTARRVRLLIVDDHEIVRLGLRALLGGQPEFEIAGEATSATDAVAAAVRLRPDVVIMDIRLPDGSGVEACREVKSVLPETQVVMLTSYPDEEAVEASVVAGASGYLLKQSRGDELIRAIRVAASGGSLLDAGVTTALLNRFRRLVSGDEHMPDPLTPQERRILALIAEGKTNREIGAVLRISEKTVKNYVTALLAKLRLKRRTEAAAFAARRGIRP
ncbi:MAG: response regulator transcription factor [Armatimonadota bacterium]|nr:response regulator transcription factor [Armatimonadota bacterium]MDR7537684.1 response regulator transcription factor [Armatimonadota bacterium]MDR7548261.1 response regulator transcription factor [Armatimonadota bacterium]